MRLSLDHIHHHKGEGGTEYECRLRVYEGHRKPAVVVAEALPGFPPISRATPFLAFMVFEMIESGDEGIWWVEKVATGEETRVGQLPEGEQWTMVWLSRETVQQAMSARPSEAIKGEPVDPAMVRLMILPCSL